MKLEPPDHWEPELSEPVAAFRATYDTMRFDKQGRMHLTLLIGVDQKSAAIPITDNPALGLQLLVCRMPEADYKPIPDA